MHSVLAEGISLEMRVRYVNEEKQKENKCVNCQLLGKLLNATLECFKNAVIISYEHKSKQTTDAFMQRAI